MPSRREIVEKALGVRVPDQYAKFLEEYGIYSPFGVEVYGVDDRLRSYDGAPCVIGATQKLRKALNLPHRFLVVCHTGFEDEKVCLDTEDEKVYSISRYLGNRKIADSFDEWFERDILECVKRDEQRRANDKYRNDRIIWLSPSYPSGDGR